MLSPVLSSACGPMINQHVSSTEARHGSRYKAQRHIDHFAFRSTVPSRVNLDFLYVRILLCAYQLTNLLALEPLPVC